MPLHKDFDWFMDTAAGSRHEHDPQDATPYDCPNPPHLLEDFVDLVASSLNRDRSMGDEAEILEIEQHGLYGLRLKMASGQIFLIRIGLDPI
jgi:hypothetical protein